MIAVAGASGRQGGAVARQLHVRGHKVRALTRNPRSIKARALVQEGIEVARCDFSSVQLVREALADCQAMFLTTTPYEKGVEDEERQAVAAITIAREQGVQQIVYSSVAAANQKSGVPHFESKGRIERALSAAALPFWAVVRPVFFMEMFLEEGFRRLLHKGRIEMVLAPGDTIAMVAVADIAAFSLLAFEHSERFHQLRVELAGDQPSMAELASAFSAVLERPVEYRQVEPAEITDDSKPRLATQLWLQHSGWTVDHAALRKEYGLALATVEDWARRHRDKLLARP